MAKWLNQTEKGLFVVFPYGPRIRVGVVTHNESAAKRMATVGRWAEVLVIVCALTYFMFNRHNQSMSNLWGYAAILLGFGLMGVVNPLVMLGKLTYYRRSAHGELI